MYELALPVGADWSRHSSSWRSVSLPYRRRLRARLPSAEWSTATVVPSRGYGVASTGPGSSQRYQAADIAAMEAVAVPQERSPRC
jgi:hypothetical protein